MKSISSIGLVLFLVALAIFTSLIFVSTFEVTDASLQSLSTIIQDKHQAAVLPAIEELKGRSFSKYAFISSINDILNEANSNLANDSKIWDYDFGQYQMAIARYSLTGVIGNQPGLLFFADDATRHPGWPDALFTQVQTRRTRNQEQWCLSSCCAKSRFTRHSPWHIHDHFLHSDLFQSARDR